MTGPRYVSATFAEVSTGDRVRLTSHTTGDQHLFTVAYRENGYLHERPSGMQGRQYFAGAGSTFDIERVIELPTIAGLYRIRTSDAHSRRGLALDKSGQWWWYDLTSSEPFSPATGDEVIEQLPRLVLVDSWAGPKPGPSIPAGSMAGTL